MKTLRKITRITKEYFTDGAQVRTLSGNGQLQRTAYEQCLHSQLETLKEVNRRSDPVWPQPIETSYSRDPQIQSMKR